MNKVLALLFASLVACSASPVLSRDGTHNTYYVFTRENPRIGVPLNPTAGSIAASPIRNSRSTAVIVHGHEGSGFSSLNPMVKDAFLTGEDVNVIVVDWSTQSMLAYRDAVNAVPSVAEFLSRLIEDLVTERRVSLETLHLVGFDLGAHVVGITGRRLNGTAARITGLNPSGSQWGSSSERIRATDARYVEILHTDDGGLFGHGSTTTLGNVDFYVNGGSGQPGCVLSTSCSHNRSWEVFSSTLTHSHLSGSRCSSSLQISLNTCRGVVLALGNNDLRKTGSGQYRVNTGRTYPF